MKGIDIMIAALQSELGFLANSVGTHVQTAEMGNQSLNSLALISARYCHTALDVLSQLAGAHLFALCQAFDLRAMHIRFLEAFQPTFQDVTSQVLTPLLKESWTLELLHAALWPNLIKLLDEQMTMNSTQRVNLVVTSLQPLVLKSLSSSENTIPLLDSWTKQCSEAMLQTFDTNLDLYSAYPDAAPFLGKAARRMYSFVRHDLAVPFLRAHHYKSPVSEQDGPEPGHHSENLDDIVEEDNGTVGSYLTVIYSAIRNGSLYVPVMECLREAQQIPESSRPVGEKASKPGKFVDSLVSESRIAV